MNDRVSVCIATYNGHEWILVQLHSVLSQLTPNDEIIIVDDCSTDSTISEILSISDNRIKLFKNECNQGHVKSFARALSLSQGKYVFMCDQDDLWKPGRVQNMVDALSDGCKLLITTRFDFFGNNIPNGYNEKFNFLKASDSNRNIFNICKIFSGSAVYFGCAMAMNSKFFPYILPIPKYVESHDLWLALAANILGKNGHLDIISLSRRIHGKNASVVSRSLIHKVKSRFLFILSIFHLLGRIFYVRYLKY